MTVTIDPDYATALDVDSWLPTIGEVRAIRFTGADHVREAASLRFNLATESALVINGVTSTTSYVLTTALPPPTQTSVLQAYSTPTVKDSLPPSVFPTDVASSGDIWNELGSLKALFQEGGVQRRRPRRYGVGARSQHCPAHDVLQRLAVGGRRRTVRCRVRARGESPRHSDPGRIRGDSSVRARA